MAPLRRLPVAPQEPTRFLLIEGPRTIIEGDLRAQGRSHDRVDPS
jgi:hypothetical protein